MTVEKKYFRSVSKAIEFLDTLACDHHLEYVFRGHRDSKHHLRTTLERYWPIQHSDDDPTINRMIRQYKDGLSRMGLHLPSGMTALDCLEHARHYGLPAPLLDFSWSPYVALFFSVDGVGYLNKPSKSVVYALNLTQLALHWVRNKTDDRGTEFGKLCDKFLYSSEPLHDHFPGNSLAVIRDPGPYSTRMHNQLGAFIYCTLDYDSRGCKDFEDYLHTVNEEQDRHDSPRILIGKRPVLTKVFIKHDWATEIFQRLELWNITGAKLFGIAEGVAADVWNSYHYHPKTAFLRRDEE